MISSNPIKILRDSRTHRHTVPVSHPGCERGFTLIEVVVALAIVVVSFMALYGVILQMVRATTLMQEKTIASWIAFDQITELRIKGEFPTGSDNSGIIEMAETTWAYSVEIRPTGSSTIHQVIVTVAPEAEPDRTLGLVSGVLVGAAPAGRFPAPRPGPVLPPPDEPIVSGASPVRGPTR
jgi:general secretion pathway protein I